MDLRRPFKRTVWVLNLALTWLALGSPSAGAYTTPMNPAPLSREYLMAQGRMEASGRVIQPKLGTQQTFWVRVPNDTLGLIYQYAQKSATLRRTGCHCYLYVEDGTQVPDSVLDDLKTAYDSNIYPNCRRNFGHEWNPGIDGDSLVTILLSSSLRVEFYFSPFDEMPDSLAQTKGHRSNEREMFYLRPGEDVMRMKGLMAHCEEHLIHWWQNPPGEIWLDEACAMYAMDLCGFESAINEVQAFQNNPSLNMTEWPSRILDIPLYPSEDSEHMWARRGEQYAFLAYLMDKYPGNDPQHPLIYYLVARRDLNLPVGFIKKGIDNVQRALWETGSSTFWFYDIFPPWTVAVFVNDTTLALPGVASKVFGYRRTLGGSSRFKVNHSVGPPDLFQSFPDSAFLAIPWYGQAYCYIPGVKSDLQVEIAQDTAVWWSEGARCTGFLYRGYVITSTTEDFATGTNTISSLKRSPSETLSLNPGIKGIKIVPSLLPSLPDPRGGEAPRFYVFAYTPFIPGDTTISRSAYVFPNPFNPEREKVHFRYVLEKASQVDIRVYDAAGNQIAVIADQQETPPGIYNSQTWDGRNYRGTPVANGVYFGRMKIGKATTGFKIAVIR